jgi:histidyl-tRNA synthetase
VLFRSGLIEEFGGKPTPGLGFAVGLERIVLVLEALGVELPKPVQPQVFVAAAGNEPEVRVAAFACAVRLRAAGVAAELDHQARSLKSQLKLADKSGARYCVLIGADELAAKELKLKDLQTHEERTVPVSDLLPAIGVAFAKAPLH